MTSLVAAGPLFGRVEQVEQLARRVVRVVFGGDGLAGCDSDEGGAEEASVSRVVTGANGDVTIPVDPRRVVAVDPVTTEHLAALGIEAVGATVDGFFADLAPLHPDAEHILGSDGINLERVAALRPDLILGWPAFVEGAEDQLGSIAPYVGTVREGFLDWRADLG